MVYAKKLVFHLAIFGILAQGMLDGKHLALLALFLGLERVRLPLARPCVWCFFGNKEPMGIPYKAIFCGDIPLHRPKQ